VRCTRDGTTLYDASSQRLGSTMSGEASFAADHSLAATSEGFRHLPLAATRVCRNRCLPLLCWSPFSSLHWSIWDGSRMGTTSSKLAYPNFGSLQMEPIMYRVTCQWSKVRKSQSWKVRGSGSSRMWCFPFQQGRRQDSRLKGAKPANFCLGGGANRLIFTKKLIKISLSHNFLPSIPWYSGGHGPCWSPLAPPLLAMLHEDFHKGYMNQTYIEGRLRNQLKVQHIQDTWCATWRLVPAAHINTEDHSPKVKLRIYLP
jgi:hypothetical protein